jgi:hypothetical protein
VPSNASAQVNYIHLNGSLIAKLYADTPGPNAAGRDASGSRATTINPFAYPYANAPLGQADSTPILLPIETGGTDGKTLLAKAEPLPGTTYRTHYVHTDALGSPVVETHSGGGEIPDTRTLYEPYGKPLTTLPRQNLLFGTSINWTGTGVRVEFLFGPEETNAALR